MDEHGCFHFVGPILEQGEALFAKAEGLTPDGQRVEALLFIGDDERLTILEFPSASGPISMDRVRWVEARPPAGLVGP